MKIDVDGIERKIINGAKKTLNDPRLREMIIELNTHFKEDMEIVEILKEAGFEMKGRYNIPLDTEFAHIFNYHFVKITNPHS